MEKEENKSEFPKNIGMSDAKDIIKKMQEAIKNGTIKTHWHLPYIRVPHLVAMMKGILNDLRSIDPKLEEYTKQILKILNHIPVSSSKKFKTPKLSFRCLEAEEYRNKLKMQTKDFIDWQYIYSFGYYFARDERRCLGWKESMREFAKIIKEKRKKVSKGDPKDPYLVPQPQPPAAQIKMTSAELAALLRRKE